MSRCRSCDARIRWAKTATGKNMPIDLDPHPDGNLVIVDGIATVYANPLGAAQAHPDAPRYVSHWQTCPTAFEHRRVARQKATSRTTSRRGGRSSSGAAPDTPRLLDMP